MKMGSERTRKSPGHNLMDMYSRIKLRVLDDRVSAGRHGNSAFKNVKSMNVQSEESWDYHDIKFRGTEKKKEGMDYAVTPEELAINGNKTCAARSSKMVELMALTKQKVVISSKDLKGSIEARKGPVNLDFDFCNSTLDEGTALGMVDTSKDVGYRYEVGDMVWGKIEPHPWWPGQIFVEAFACPSVRDTKKDGHVLVAFYGDCTYGWFEQVQLIPFDPHYTEKLKQTNANAFLTAVEEAEGEVQRRAALGLTCCCRNPNNFRPTSVHRFFEVDVSGFEPGSVYSLKQIKRARNGFQPRKTLSFLQKLALMPQNVVRKNVEWMKNVAHFLAYRRAVFEEFDETYAQAFGVQPVLPRGSSVVLTDPEEALLQAPSSSQPVITKTLGESKGFTEQTKVKDQQKSKKSLPRWNNEVDISEVHKLRKAENCGSRKRASPIAIKPMFLKNQEANGTFGRDFASSSLGTVGKEAMTAAPLSSQPMIAKTLGENKGFEEQIKVKDQQKREFLSRWNNDVDVSNRGSQKRAPPIAMKPMILENQDANGTFGEDFADSNLGIVGKEAITAGFHDTKLRPKLESHALRIQQKTDHPSGLKPLKRRFRPDDPTQSSNQCQASCHLQDKYIKIPKEVKRRKSSVAKKEEHNHLKPRKVQRDEQMVGPSVSTKPVKLTPKTLEGDSEPTMVIMKFPPRSTLPSVSELKARFVRFGMMDESATRVFWKSSTCQVVFKNSSNAQAAYNQAVSNRTLFGNMKVNYCLQPLKVSVLGLPKSGGNASSREERSLPGINNNTANSDEVIPQTLPMSNNCSVDHIVMGTNMKHVQDEPRNKASYQNVSAVTNNIDISQQMLSLLKKCSDIVAELERSMG